MSLVQNIEIQKYTISGFIEILDMYSEKLKAVNDRITLKTCIASEFNSIVNYFIKLGDLTSEDTSKPQNMHLVNYVLSEDFKTLMLLHRDVFLELNKASISRQEQQLSDEQLSNHYEQSKEILVNKLTDFQNLLSLEKDKANDTNLIKKIARKISLQTNPWGVYKSQYDTILYQIKDIDTKKVLAFRYVATFNELKSVVTRITNEHDKLVNTIHENISHIVKHTNDSADINGLIAYVEDQLDQQLITENKHFSFSETVNNHIDGLEKIEIPINSINGLLSMREINLQKRTHKWFDYQILPEFMDLMGLETNLINKYNLNLVNLKNSLQLSKEKHEDVKFDTILHILSHLEDDLKEMKPKGQRICEALKNKVNTELLMTNLVTGKPFLEVTLNSSLNIESSTFLKKIMQNVQKGTSYFNSQYKKSLQYESLSNMELSIQCIAHRMFQDESSHYDSLFLNKQFIGDLFLVPRRDQEDKLKRIVDHWNQGFNKAVLVRGDRLSGRSTFLDYSAKKFFGKDIVILKPNSNATIDGRKFKTSNDLKEALIYVKNNNIKSTRPIILIDDLELWRDDKHNLLHNIRALINFIETESDDAFVMASVTNMMVNHLDNRLNFSSAFSHIITTNDADENEIVDAILLRHGAAHRDLISEDLEAITTHKLRILARKLCKQNAYNFGNTLQAWTFNTFVQDNEQVIYKDSYFEFLDFFTPHEVIILKQALIYRYISEYGIKNVTTTSFDTEFKSALRRLMNVKVLLRDINGSLYINPVIVNDVTRIITNKTNA